MHMLRAQQARHFSPLLVIGGVQGQEMKRDRLCLLSSTLRFCLDKMKTNKTGTAASYKPYCLLAQLIISLPHSHQIRGCLRCLNWANDSECPKLAFDMPSGGIVLYACNRADMETCWHWPVTCEGNNGGHLLASLSLVLGLSTTPGLVYTWTCLKAFTRSQYVW